MAGQNRGHTALYRRPQTTSPLGTREVATCLTSDSSQVGWMIRCGTGSLLFYTL